MQIEIVEIVSGRIVHEIPVTGEDRTSRAAQRLMEGVLNNIGRFDCRLSRGGHEEVDDRLDLNRYFARYSSQ